MSGDQSIAMTHIRQACMHDLRLPTRHQQMTATAPKDPISTCSQHLSHIVSTQQASLHAGIQPLADNERANPDNWCPGAKSSWPNQGSHASGIETDLETSQTLMLYTTERQGGIRESQLSGTTFRWRRVSNLSRRRLNQ